MFNTPESETNTPRLFLALMPPSEVEQHANQIIQELSDRYHTRTANAPPHITVQAPFRWPHDKIPVLEERLRQFSQRYASIPIEISGFGSFGKRVLYIHVRQTEPLITLQSDLANYLNQTFQIIDPSAKSRSFTPHMTVASRNMTPKTFHQAWEILQQQSVDFHYWSDRLTLLIYRDHQWHIKAELPFIGDSFSRLS